MGLISLGCAKNLVDAEVMLGSLLKDGMEITNDPSSADVVIVNTCSFIDAAQEESVDAILESNAVREAHNRGQALVVSGCLPQRFREELPKLIPEVDAFIGIDQVADIPRIVENALRQRASRLNSTEVESEDRKTVGRKRSTRLKKGGSVAGANSERTTSIVARSERLKRLESAGPSRTVAKISSAPLVHVNKRPKYVPDFATPRFRLTPKHFAYVKIAEGCNHPCSFCTIPRMRGPHRSREQQDIVDEARQLIAAGVKELNLISQDSTYYGLDLSPNRHGSIASPGNFNAATKALPKGATTLSSLLRALNALRGDFWIRLLYTHPAHWTDELIQTIADCPKVARYVDMPLQHIHDNMLERMRRETSRQHIVDLIRRMRDGIPGIAIRTTFIVGFPGETTAHFESLMDFIRETKFERLGIFTYSSEAGTRSANMMSQIPAALKKRRRQIAMKEQLKIVQGISQSFVGRQIRVLVEKTADGDELQNANLSSWEHGMLRTGSQKTETVTGKYMIARAEADAPDIDGRVLVQGKLPDGEFAAVKIIGHTGYDLIAQRVRKSRNRSSQLET